MRIKALALFTAGAAALALALTTAGPAGATTATGTPASGSVTVTETNTFLAQAAQAGIIAIPLPSATPSYNSTTGATVTFPVTGGSGDLAQFYGNITLGGGLLVVDCKTGKSVQFHQLAFSIDNYYLTGVADGTTTAVPLLDAVGDLVVSNIGVTPETLTGGSAGVDAAGAQYLDNALNTTFFTGGQVVGPLGVTFTPGS